MAETTNTPNPPLKKAVALRYDQLHSDAPQVVAAGKGTVAEKILEAAEKAGIHIQHDPDLVELLAQVDVGKEIPAELYQTVAEVLSFVYRMNNRHKEYMEEYMEQSRNSPHKRKG